MNGCLLLIALALVATAGCGEEGRTFTPSEFVEEMNDEGANLTLGAVLRSAQEGVEVYEVRLGRDGVGTLMEARDPEGGSAEYERCESALDLLCYRAANVVVFFDGAETAVGDLASVEAAIKALAGN